VAASTFPHRANRFYKTIMRLYLAGAGGMLGEALHKILSEKHRLKCTDIDLNEPWLEFCDFRDFNAYESSVAAFGPDMLLHVGAHTNLEYCENNPDEAYCTNALSVEHATIIANKHGIPLVYISSAGIFDGTKLLYDDWDRPNPLSVYGRSKYIGELAVQSVAQRYFIFRAGWMMGGGPRKDKKFIFKLIKQIANNASVLRIVDDRLGTPTYTIDFARNLEAVIQTEFYGLYNMVCAGETGRLEVGQELVRLLGLESKVGIERVSSDHFADEYFAPRPRSERLVNYRLKLRSLDLMRDWRLALSDYLRDYFSDFVRTFAPAPCWRKAADGK
jgi:dTDP-4-dehydrorhamnose reductase